MARKKIGRGRGSPMVMHKAEMKRVLQSRMKCLLNFLNEDIGSLNPIECLKLLLDFFSFLHGFAPLGFLEIGFEPKTHPSRMREFLHRAQDKLRWMLNQILVAANTGPDQFVELLPGICEFTIKYHVTVIEDRICTASSLITPIPGGELQFMIMESEDDLPDFLANALIAVLSPFPLSRIKICQRPDCGNYFFQKTTKSKGDFCSPKCQNWARANRWRQNHRDEYNNYHRERRLKAKVDRVEIKCPSCGHRESKGSFSDYLKGHSLEEDCPQCEKAKLLHIVTRWDKSERSWIPEEYTFIEWNEYIKGIQEREG